MFIIHKVEEVVELDLYLQIDGHMISMGKCKQVVTQLDMIPQMRILIHAVFILVILTVVLIGEKYLIIKLGLLQRATTVGRRVTWVIFVISKDICVRIAVH